MKQLSGFLLFILLAAGLYASSESAPPAALFPAYDHETGYYGYIDTNGQWMIAPRFETAGEFRGRYAAVSTADPWDYTMGIIDSHGQWVVEPVYFVDEGYDEWTYGGLNEGMYLIWDGNEGGHLNDSPHYAFFDVPSGYFSGIVFDDEMRWWTQEKLVPIGDAYYDRTNGTMAFELPDGYFTDWLGGDSVFHDGFAPILKEVPGGDDLDCFVNTQGSIVELDHLKYNREGWACGLLLCQEDQPGPGEPVIGYFDLNAMNWRITSYSAPDGTSGRFLEAYPFSGNGYACVKLENGHYGHIDTQGSLLFGDGEVILKSGTGIKTIQISQPYRFYGDYAWVQEANALIDPHGRVAVAFPDGWTPYVQSDDEMEDTGNYYVSPGGVIELRRSVRGKNQSGLMNLDGEWLLDPAVYERCWEGLEPHRFFSHGLQAVSKKVGIKEWRTVHYLTGDEQEPVYQTKVGYVDEHGQVVVDFIYDSGGAFLNGLALVEKGDETGYINTRGQEVFFWTASDPDIEE